MFGQVLLFGDRTPDLAGLREALIRSLQLLPLSFLAVGWLAVRLLHMAVRQPVWLVGLLILFVTLETAVYVVSFALFQGTGAEHSGDRSSSATLAVLVMGTYLWRTHRLVVRYVARVPLGDTGDELEVKTPRRGTPWHAGAPTGACRGRRPGDWSISRRPILARLERAAPATIDADSPEPWWLVCFRNGMPRERP